MHKYQATRQLDTRPRQPRPLSTCARTPKQGAGKKEATKPRRAAQQAHTCTHVLQPPRHYASACVWPKGGGGASSSSLTAAAATPQGVLQAIDENATAAYADKQGRPGGACVCQRPGARCRHGGPPTELQWQLHVPTAGLFKHRKLLVSNRRSAPPAPPPPRALTHTQPPPLCAVNQQPSLRQPCSLPRLAWWCGCCKAVDEAAACSPPPHTLLLLQSPPAAQRSSHTQHNAGCWRCPVLFLLLLAFSPSSPASHPDPRSLPNSFK